MKKNLQTSLLELLETDTDFSSLNERNIRQKYLSSSESEKQTIDSIFIDLTGFSLESIIQQSEVSKVGHSQVPLVKKPMLNIEANI